MWTRPDRAILRRRWRRLDRHRVVHPDRANRLVDSRCWPARVHPPCWTPHPNRATNTTPAAAVAAIITLGSLGSFTGPQSVSDLPA